MNATPPAQAQAIDLSVFQSLWYRLLLLFFVPYLVVLWFVLGPANPGYAVNVVAATFALGPAIADPIARRVPARWFRVPVGERLVHRILGVAMFGSLLDLSGWNRRVAEPMRGFSGKRAGLTGLAYAIRANICAHGTCFVIHAILAVIALFGRSSWRGALWMLLPGVAVHLYPVLLQRSILLRLQPLLDKTDSC